MKTHTLLYTHPSRGADPWDIAAEYTGPLTTDLLFGELVALQSQPSYAGGTVSIDGGPWTPIADVDLAAFDSLRPIALNFFDPTHTTHIPEEGKFYNGDLGEARNQARDFLALNSKCLAILTFNNDPHDNEQIPGADYDAACAEAQRSN